MLEEQLRGPLQERSGLGARFGQRTIEVERVADRGRRLVVRHRSARQGVEKLRDLIDEPVAERAEGCRVHGERSMSRHLGTPSKRSVSRTRPPLTVLNTR